MVTSIKSESKIEDCDDEKYGTTQYSSQEHHKTEGTTCKEYDTEWTTRELRQMQTADPVGMWTESPASTLYSTIVNRHNLLSIPTGSAVCICLNSLVVHSVSYSIYLHSLIFFAIDNFCECM